MGNVTSFHVTGDWRHVVDDGMVDVDALPDEALPTGHVVFTPLSPKVAVAGAPAVAHTFGEIKALISAGELTDLQGRAGVWMAGDIGGQTVRWRATTHLFYQGQKIAYPVLEFDLTGDAVLTGIIQNSEPGQPPIVIDPRIEALIADAQAVLSQAQDAIEGLEDSAAGASAARDEAVASAAAALVSEGKAKTSETNAAGSASAADAAKASAESARSDAQTQASNAASSASAAGSAQTAAEAARDSAAMSATNAAGSATDSESSRVGAAQIRDDLLALLEDSEAWAGFQEALAQIEPRMAAKIDELKGDAPAAFDTLGEVAAWIADSEDASAAMLQSISERAKKTYVDEQLSGKAPAGAENTAQWGQVSGKPTSYPSSWSEVSGKPSTFPTSVGDLSATGTASSTTYLRGDGSWATPTNTTYSVPTQAEAEAGTSTTGRAFSAQRTRQAADAAISARIQLVSDFPSSPVAGVLYLKAES